MSNTLHLTKRDIAILNDSYRYTVVSFSQLHQWHFPNRAVPTVSNRLNQLVAGHYLKKERIASFPTAKGRIGSAIVFQTTKKGRDLLRHYVPEILIQEKSNALNTNTLAHDLLLNDSLKALGMRFQSMDIVHGRLLETEHNRAEKLCPDAVIFDPGNKNIAVELELTEKSNKRYREITLHYRLTPKFHKVLYVVSGNRIAEKIKFHITGQKSSTLSLKNLPSGKFYFVTLNELLKDPLHAKISNGSEEPIIPFKNGQTDQIGAFA